MRKLNFLIDSGIPEQDAEMAMLAANYFTVGHGSNHGLNGKVGGSEAFSEREK